jgi:hypothetical protein
MITTTWRAIRSITAREVNTRRIVRGGAAERTPV